MLHDIGTRVGVRAVVFLVVARFHRRVQSWICRLGTVTRASASMRGVRGEVVRPHLAICTRSIDTEDDRNVKIPRERSSERMRTEGYVTHSTNSGASKIPS